MKKGGTARSIRNLTIWIILVTIVLSWSLLAKKKGNYSLLHHRVNQIELQMEAHHD